MANADTMAKSKRARQRERAIMAAEYGNRSHGLKRKTGAMRGEAGHSPIRGEKVGRTVPVSRLSLRLEKTEPARRGRLALTAFSKME